MAGIEHKRVTVVADQAAFGDWQQFFSLLIAEIWLQESKIFTVGVFGLVADYIPGTIP
jgi:hypothetical protein